MIGNFIMCSKMNDLIELSQKECMSIAGGDQNSYEAGRALGSSLRHIWYFIKNTANEYLDSLANDYANEVGGEFTNCD